MPSVRIYREARDHAAVGRLIADTFARFNLDFADPPTREALLGPFARARSADPAHVEAIRRAIRSEIVLVAEEEGAITGVLRGRRTRLGSLFVAGERHRRGTGTALVRRFERSVADQGGGLVRVAATLLAVPFYQRLGYRKTTGPRNGESFGVRGLPYQPMAKDVAPRAGGR